MANECEGSRQVVPMGQEVTPGLAHCPECGWLVSLEVGSKVPVHEIVPPQPRRIIDTVTKLNVEVALVQLEDGHIEHDMAMHDIFALLHRVQAGARIEQLELEEAEEPEPYQELPCGCVWKNGVGPSACYGKDTSACTEGHVR